ncbi:MAG: type II toxin-antitoxin system RelE/ParE family toxin [Flavobacteriales bacterium]|nr:type II toxin-antitoxin system RelE/ParE family toxin [Flavobacteriales bacterium]
MIIWSPEAATDYQSNIEFLLIRWTEREAAHFIAVTNEILNLIENNPHAFRSVGYKQVRAAVILPQITLFYRVEENGAIELIRFWNNYQNPQKLKF